MTYSVSKGTLNNSRLIKNFKKTRRCSKRTPTLLILYCVGNFFVTLYHDGANKQKKIKHRLQTVRFALSIGSRDRMLLCKFSNLILIAKLETVSPLIQPQSGFGSIFTEIDDIWSQAVLFAFETKRFIAPVVSAAGQATV